MLTAQEGPSALGCELEPPRGDLPVGLPGGASRRTPPGFREAHVDSDTAVPLAGVGQVWGAGVVSGESCLDRQGVVQKGLEEGGSGGAGRPHSRAAGSRTLRPSTQLQV